MNFLEQLVSEWYTYQGCFTRTNMRFGKMAKGGYKGEIDVIAFHPKTRVLTHVEVSTDAISWAQRKIVMNRKFKDANEHFKELFNFEVKEIKRLVVLEFTLPKKPIDFGNGIELITIPQLIQDITADLVKRDPLKDMVPEEQPLLRALQFGANYGVSEKSKA